MVRKAFDPLTVIPSAAAIRAKLAETARLAARLRILLAAAERLEEPSVAIPVLTEPGCDTEGREGVNA